MTIRSALLAFVWCACAAHSPAPAQPADADGDGIPDSVDKCPNDPEDYDGWEDDDGCPDPDESDHIITDVDDRCPIVLDCDDEFIDNDGCPDVILIFAPDSSTLRPDATRLIDELAEELRVRKRVVKLRLDGHHLDSEPAELAVKRAEAVRERLIAQGTPATMLEVASYAAPSGSDPFVSFFAVTCAD